MSERRGTKALELWCRRVTEGYPGVKVDNMTSAWRDGLAFCAMIHHFRPDLIDFEKLNKSDVYYNNALAFTTAEKYLGIPALLDADDMAAFEVPDRLSILTYLSQFYQVFAAQEAHNRLKRSSSSAADKTQISKSTGPPSKMAHVVGVPKRDPCRKCQLPVFLAERLMVGKNVYHRTCLKCARCGYQLTPGSFYETEIDEQYCCETCPDEEVLQENAENLPLDSEVTAPGCLDVELRNAEECETKVLPSSVTSIRSSVKERLAFFENHRNDDEPETKLLQKSLSDEEKSKSLQRIENTDETITAPYKSNAALSNFLVNIVDDDEDTSDPTHSPQNSKMEITESEDDTEDLDNFLPPELPKSLPPLVEFNVTKEPQQKKRFSVSTQIALDPSLYVEDDQQNIVIQCNRENPTVESQVNLLPSAIDNTTNTSNKNNNNSDDEAHISEPPDNIEHIAKHQGHEKKDTVQLHPKKLEDNLEFSETNDNDCITKDKSADEFIPNVETGRKETTDIDNKPVKEDFVELRTKTNNQHSNMSLQFEDGGTTEGLSVMQQLKDETTNNEKKEEISLKNEKLNHSEILNNEEDIASQLIKKESLDKVTDEEGTTILVNNLAIKNENETESLRTTLIDDKVPLIMQTKDNEKLESNVDDRKEDMMKHNYKDKDDFQTTPQNNSKTNIEEYPNDLNPFKSDEDEDEELLESNKENLELKKTYTTPKNKNLNPFDSSDDEVELEKIQKSTPKIPPPRPPPPRISKNPFGSEDEDEISSQNFTRRSSLTGSQSRKTPVPTPRSNISQSQNPTPEPTPRLSAKAGTVSGYVTSTTSNNSPLPILQNSSEFYGSANSVYSNNLTPHNLLRNSDVRSSNISLNLSAGGTIRSRKSRRAPLPPAPVKELFPSNETINNSSKASTPSSSTVGTPKSSRKKRPAPAPPKPARLEPAQIPQAPVDTVNTETKNLNTYPLQSELDSKLSDEEKALLEGKVLHDTESDLSLSPSSRRSSKRLIPLDQELLEEHGRLQYVAENNSHCDDLKQQNQQKYLAVYEEEASVVYRRVLIPQNLETPTHEHNLLIEDLSKSPSLGERQLEKLKDNKEANNRNRQSQISVTSSGADENDPLFNKSAQGKWKRRKGPAPALPIPPRKVLQMLPLQEIKHELEIIEVQQQGLEKQGVILEKMIRDRCEGENGEPLNMNGAPIESGDSASCSSTAENSKEVENLILQLFELVNEKNELFRRQAELMYLRRQHRLEQEQADLEYEIRILMAQPERNKTDSDKAREEALIERLVEVVQLRNEVVECLEMDRIREAEEDQSIKQRLESHIAKREDESNLKKTLAKLSKKEKKKQKEAKKLLKGKKLDADKDADESEINVDKLKSKKKKKLLIF